MSETSRGSGDKSFVVGQTLAQQKEKVSFSYACTCIYFTYIHMFSCLWLCLCLFHNCKSGFTVNIAVIIIIGIVIIVAAAIFKSEYFI